jgi:signal transduction histidine kinase
MSRLISDLLNLEKIESGTRSWAMSHCDVREIIRTVAAVLAPCAAEKGVALRFHLPLAQIVWADADRIQEVITNLIGNGIKFCSRGGRIEVRLRRSRFSGPGRLGGEYALIEVTDDGPGIQLEEREHIFEKFYQGGGSGFDRSGSGLGLAIAKDIVLHHQGEIWLDSMPGTGSRFCFTLPLRSPDREFSMHPAVARTEA